MLYLYEYDKTFHVKIVSNDVGNMDNSCVTLPIVREQVGKKNYLGIIFKENFMHNVFYYFIFNGTLK